MRELTLRETIDALAQVVESRSWSHTYTDEIGGDGACRYARADGSPACIVGHALARLGVPLPTPGDEHDPLYTPEPNFASIAGPVMERYLLEHRIVLAKDAKKALAAAQNAQDEGAPWGAALERARNSMLSWVGAEREGQA